MYDLLYENKLLNIVLYMINNLRILLLKTKMQYFLVIRMNTSCLITDLFVLQIA